MAPTRAQRAAAPPASPEFRAACASSNNVLMSDRTPIARRSSMFTTSSSSIGVSGCRGEVPYRSMRNSSVAFKGMASARWIATSSSPEIHRSMQRCNSFVGAARLASDLSKRVGPAGGSGREASQPAASAAAMSTKCQRIAGATRAVYFPRFASRETGDAGTGGAETEPEQCIRAVNDPPRSATTLPIWSW